MVYFRRIRKTRHYREEHEREVPWHKVVELIFATKNPRKKEDVFEIDDGKHYILFTIREGTLYVINAKRK